MEIAKERPFSILSLLFELPFPGIVGGRPYERGMERTVGILEYEADGIAVSRAVAQSFRIARSEYVEEVHHVAIADRVVSQKPNRVVRVFRFRSIGAGLFVHAQELMIESPFGAQRVVRTVAENVAVHLPFACKVIDEIVMPPGHRSLRHRRNWKSQQKEEERAEGMFHSAVDYIPIVPAAEGFSLCYPPRRIGFESAKLHSIQEARRVNIGVNANMVTTTFEIPGYRVVKNLGLVRGVTVRSRSIVGQIGASLESLVGGNITLFEEMCENTRSEALGIMMEHAAGIGANAIIGVRYDACEIMQGITEVLAYGTAVRVEPAS